MTQTERIALMEQHLDRAKEALASLTSAMEEFLLWQANKFERFAEPSVRAERDAAQEAVDALSKYYGSRQWRKDLADDEAGRLPPDLKRGVLAEDGIWNVLEEWRELKERMAVVCNK